MARCLAGQSAGQCSWQALMTAVEFSSVTTSKSTSQLRAGLSTAANWQWQPR